MAESYLQLVCRDIRVHILHFLVEGHDERTALSAKAVFSRDEIVACVDKHGNEEYYNRIVSFFVLADMTTDWVTYVRARPRRDMLCKDANTALDESLCKANESIAYPESVHGSYVFYAYFMQMPDILFQPFFYAICDCLTTRGDTLVGIWFLIELWQPSSEEFQSSCIPHLISRRAPPLLMPKLMERPQMLALHYDMWLLTAKHARVRPDKPVFRQSAFIFELPGAPNILAKAIEGNNMSMLAFCTEFPGIMQPHCDAAVAAANTLLTDSRERALELLSRIAVPRSLDCVVYASPPSQTICNII